MLKSVKKIGIPVVLTFLFAISVIFNACDIEMGLGKAVDTTPPEIKITSPVDGQYMLGIVQGNSITFKGIWWDDIGVTELRFSEGYSNREFTRTSGNLEYAINQDGTWSASLLLLESGRYSVIVTAFDSFRNRGKAEVEIEIDIIPPWVEDAWISRSPPPPPISNQPFRAELRDRGFYEGIRFNVGSKPYKNIKLDNIDDYQNEVFSLRIKIDTSISGIAASRLNIYDEDDVMLNETPIKPVSGGNSSLYEPEWVIDEEMLVNTFARPDLRGGPHFIRFEVMAWNRAAWDPDANGGEGGGRQGEPYLIDNIKGTCWYPESDQPHAFVQDNSEGDWQITINQNSNFPINFYDDDRLTEIYAALIKKAEFDELLSLSGETSEENYLESLLTNKARRDDLISKKLGSNLFKSGSSPGDRSQVVSLPTGTRGEYRLIALAKDNEIWGVYQPLRVNVVDLESPMIIVENPSAENIFPVMDVGGIGKTKFKISGYTIDREGTNYVIIAWVPAGAGLSDESVTRARSAITAAESWSFGTSRVVENQIKVWKLQKGERSTVEYSSGGRYTRDNFSQTFDILDDFKYDEKTENKSKIFVIGTSNGSVLETIPFILTDYEEPPVIHITYPQYDRQIHSKEDDLILKMTASPAVNNGIGIASMTIKDITTSDNWESSFENDPAPVDNYKERKVKKSFVSGRPEGESRTYEFHAVDILGNSTKVNRTVTISNIPALQYVTSSNAPGVYGIGTELTFEAVFTMPVLVTKGAGENPWPRLKLYSSNPGANNSAPVAKYADFEDRPRSNTMIFKYKVEEGDNIPHLFTSRNPIDKNGATITSTEKLPDDTYEDAKIEVDVVTDDNSPLINRKVIGIDGVKPNIAGVGFKQPANTTPPYYNNGKNITLELTASEQVRVSGTPIAKIYVGTAKAADAVYSSITHDGKILSFTYMVNVGPDIEAQVSWADSWIEFPKEGDSIVDMAGNSINLSTRPANLNGSPNKEAHILTKTPPVPDFTLYKNSNMTGELADDIIKTSVDIYGKITGSGNTTLYYSFENGNKPEALAANVTSFTVIDRAVINGVTNDKNSESYQPAEYQVTAWQVDRAGNRSANAEARKVIYNARAPELREISCSQPNGAYRQGGVLTFRLSFSRTVTAGSGATARLSLRGTKDNVYKDETIIPTTMTAETSDSILVFSDYIIPPGLQMWDIKAYKIEFSGITDEYGNSLKNYDGTAAENNARRPITNASSFNLKRDSVNNAGGLKIDSKAPYITNYSPSAPAKMDLQYNGGVIENNKIVLTFDKNVYKQSGGSIIIRPWNEWAVPPVLSAADMDTIYSANFYNNTNPYTDTLVSNTDKTEYQKRLKWIDANGLPQYTPGTNAAMLEERNNYNYYTYTTRGISSIGDQARPDTTGQWVLAFRHDIYEGVDDLREVFNAARWKWQIISSSSGLVSINNNVVTITLSEELQPGRIWEVMISKGAFRDDAGNGSEELSSTDEGEGYRFWSPGTEKPVIRVDRYSQGDNYHTIFDPKINAYGPVGTANRPKIDTRVRIDCETPGASINYDTIRTHFTPAAATAGPNNASEVFTTTTLTTGLGFFNHPNINAGTGLPPYNFMPTYQIYTDRGGNPGYGNNWIGNGGSHDGGSQEAIPRDANGFFAGLLVPIDSQTAGITVPIDQNGAILYSDLEGKSDNLKSGANLANSGTARIYRALDDSGAFTYGAPVFVGDANVVEGTGRFFYAGDAYRTNSTDIGQLLHRDAVGDTDSRLFSGRRDYIVAAAQKKAVNTGPYSGTALDVSAPDYEGVYKTTVLHRNPNGRVDGIGAINGSTRLLMQGFDTPVNTTVPGFPLNESTATIDSLWYGYLTKLAWRVGTATLPTTLGTAQANNNYIWVSWDIVCDWYHKGRAENTRNADTSMNRGGFSFSSVLCTYGAVTYRFEQKFIWGIDGGTR